MRSQISLLCCGVLDGDNHKAEAKRTAALVPFEVVARANTTVVAEVVVPRATMRHPSVGVFHSICLNKEKHPS